MSWKLYICTVKCKVYRFYVSGKKRDDDEVQRTGGCVGLVVFEPWRRAADGAPVRFRAMLVSDNPQALNVIPPLDSAYVTRLDSRGILIRG